MVTIKTTAGQTAKAITTFIVVCGLIFSSCKKGDTGPAGKNGTNGKDGVANISSKNYYLSPSSWSAISSGRYQITEFDSDIADATTDGIEVFVSVSGLNNGAYFGLPTTSFFNPSDNLGYSYLNGTINLIYFYSSAPTYYITLKVVVIPPSQRKAHPNVNHHNYEEVKATYGLKD